MKLYRALPHFRLEGGLYFLTWRLHRGQVVLSMDERGVVAGAVQYFDGQRYELWGWVVMDDHVHALVFPKPAWGVEQLVHSWKSFSAGELRKGFGRRGAVWQREYFDRVVRSEEEARDMAMYILGNPAKRWPEVGAYPWVWVKGM